MGGVSEMTSAAMGIAERLLALETAVAELRAVMRAGYGSPEAVAAAPARTTSARKRFTTETQRGTEGHREEESG